MSVFLRALLRQRLQAFLRRSRRAGGDTFPPRLRGRNAACCGALFAESHGDQKQGEPDEKHDRKRAHAVIFSARNIGDQRDEEGAHKRGALAENIVDAEIFPRLFMRDDLGEIGARHRLDRALKEPDAHGEDPELILLLQKDGVHRDEEIGDDADNDEILRLDLARKHAQKDRRGERHDLRDEQRQKEHCRIQPEIGAVSDGEVYDRIHPVDKEKEREQKEKDMIWKL